MSPLSRVSVVLGAVATAALLTLVPLASGSAQLRAGSLDPTFAKRGFVIQTPGGGPTAIALQRNGKIVIAGNWRGFVTSRYNKNGTLDRSFGDGGTVTTVYSSGTDLAYTVAVQPDGKILVAGTSGYYAGPKARFSLARYRKDGSLDPSFGAGGIVTTPLGSGHATVHSLSLRPNGKIVAVGSTDDGQGTDLAVAQYNADGSLDKSFGKNGVVLKVPGISCGDADLYMGSAVLQPNGRLVAVGQVGEVFCKWQAYIVRFKRNGSLDRRFGTNGEIVTFFGTDWAGANAVAVAPHGKIVIGGALGHGAALMRLRSNGSLDHSFGRGGVVDRNLFGKWSGSYLSGVAVAPDGNVVAVGTAGNGLALARYRPDGRRDRTFGSRGRVTTPIPGWDYAAGDGMVLQPDGKIDVVGGLTLEDDPYKRGWVVARYKSQVCIAPKVRGDRIQMARRLIRRAHCSVARLKHVFSSSVADHHVVSQRPRAGRRRAFGAKVHLVVSKGKRR